MSKAANLKPVSNVHGMMDVYADMCGVTNYIVNGMPLVNISFLQHVVTPFLNEQNVPGDMKISVQRVASVNLSEPQALAVMEALKKHFETMPSKKEKS